MATLKYHLVKRKSNLGATAGKQVYTAQPIIHGKVSFNDLCREIADGSTVDTADVKAVLSRLSVVIPRILERGFSVDCGDLGTFRPSFGSKAVLSEADFDAGYITPARVVFTPRVSFKNALRTVGFEKGTPPSTGAGKTTPSSSSSTGGGSSNGHVGL